MWRRTRGGREKTRSKAVVVLWLIALVGLMAPLILSGIHVVTTSTPTLTVRDPPAVLEAGTASGCTVTLNANATGAVVNVTGTSGGSTYSSCWRINNGGDSERQFKVRYVSGTNLARLTTFKIATKDATHNVDHVVIDGGVVTQSETPEWKKLAKPGKWQLDVHEQVTSGTTSTVNVQVLLAQGTTQTSVYALYDVTLHVTAT